MPLPIHQSLGVGRARATVCVVDLDVQEAIKVVRDGRIAVEIDIGNPCQAAGVTRLHLRLKFLLMGLEIMKGVGLNL